MSSNGRSAVELQSNGSRTAVESPSILSCNHRHIHFIFVVSPPYCT